MRIEPDTRQIQRVSGERKKALYRGVVLLVLAFAALVGGAALRAYAHMCGYPLLHAGHLTAIGFALAASVVVCVAYAPGNIKESMAGMRGLLASDTYLSLENGFFAAKDIYKTMYEGCSILVDEVAEVVWLKGKYMRFLVRVADDATESRIVVNDEVVDEKLFLVDGMKYDPEEFHSFVQELIYSLPEETALTNVPGEDEPDTDKAGKMKKILPFLVIAAAAAAAEVMLYIGIL